MHARRPRTQAIEEAPAYVAPDPAWNPSDASWFGTRVLRVRGRTRPAPTGAATRCRLEGRFLQAYSSHWQTIRPQCGQQALVIAGAAHLGNVQVQTHQPGRLSPACSSCSEGQLRDSTSTA